MKQIVLMAQGADSILDKIIQVLGREFSPTKMILFGSRADGSATPTSDYDILVIVPTSDDGPLKRIQKAHAVLRGIEAAVDVFVATEKEYAEQKNDFGSICEVSTAL